MTIREAIVGLLISRGKMKKSDMIFELNRMGVAWNNAANRAIFWDLVEEGIIVHSNSEEFWIDNEE